MSVFIVRAFVELREARTRLGCDPIIPRQAGQVLNSIPLHHQRCYAALVDEVGIFHDAISLEHPQRMAIIRETPENHV